MFTKKNPNVNLILNANWFYSKKFDEYKKKLKIYWIKSKSLSLLFNNFNNNLTQNCSSYAVCEQALTLAIYSGSKKIYYIGVEGNGIAYLMTGKESHFSGKDHDYSGHKSWEWARAMNESSRGLRIWHRIADYCKKNKIELVNLSKKGLLDMIPRENFEDLFK